MIKTGCMAGLNEDYSENDRLILIVTGPQLFETYSTKDRKTKVASKACYEVKLSKN